MRHTTQTATTPWSIHPYLATTSRNDFDSFCLSRIAVSLIIWVHHKINANNILICNLYMSITFNITKEGVVDVVNIPGTEISAYLLQKLLAEKLKSK